MEVGGKAALIIGVGGENSIGRQVAIEFAKRGCNIALVGCCAKAVEETVDLAFSSTEASPLRISAHVVCGTGDLAGNVDHAQLRNEVLLEHSEIDFVVLCGGGGTATMQEQHKGGSLLVASGSLDGQWEQDFTRDVISTMRWLRAFLPDLMVAPAGGTFTQSKAICVLLTDNSYWPMPMQSALNCSQAAKKMLLQSLTVECAQLAPHILVSTATGVLPDWLIADGVTDLSTTIPQAYVPQNSYSRGEPIPLPGMVNNEEKVDEEMGGGIEPVKAMPRQGVFQSIQDPAVLSLHKTADRNLSAAAEVIVSGIIGRNSHIVLGNSSGVLGWAAALNPSACAAAYSPMPKTEGMNWSDQAKVRIIDFAVKRFWLAACSLPLVIARILDMPQVQTALKRTGVQVFHWLLILQKLAIKYLAILKLKALDASKKARDSIANRRKLSKHRPNRVGHSTDLELPPRANDEAQFVVAAPIEVLGNSSPIVQSNQMLN